MSEFSKLPRNFEGDGWVIVTKEPGHEIRAMTLDGEGGSFEMAILGYQFPDRDQGDLDSNWLVVGGKVGLQGREWCFHDPCLTTFEVMRLADWLEASSQGADGDGCGFIEPNLQFDGPANGTIRLAFALESAPPWAGRGEDWHRHGFDIVADTRLAMAADQLRRALRHFPARGRGED